MRYAPCGGDPTDRRCAGGTLIPWSIAFLVVFILAGALAAGASAQDEVPLAGRIEGLLVGSLIGDAYGVPTRSSPPVRGPWTSTDTVLTRAGMSELARRFTLSDAPPSVGPHGPWADAAPIGSLSEASRYKVLFFRSLEAAGGVDRTAFARELMAWHDDSTGAWGPLPTRWLGEPARAARWVLGERDTSRAIVSELIWGGLPTMDGQMPFLPIAALAPRRPDAARSLVTEIDFLDHGIALELNAALVGGLAEALREGADLASVERAMRAAGERGSEAASAPGRSVDAWLDFVHDSVRRADGRAARLFSILESELAPGTGREAWAPIAIVFSCAALTEGEPLATMRLIHEYGSDTAYSLHLAGALLGALHGSRIFPPFTRAAVSRRLREDYQAGLGDWMVLIDRYRLR